MNLVLIVLSVLLNSFAQILMRKGMLNVGLVGLTNLVSYLPSMATNLFLWGSIFCYGISVLLWMVVLSRVEVSFAYPFLSIGYIVAAVIAYYTLGENISLIRMIGIAFICVGVVLISRS